MNDWYRQKEIHLLKGKRGVKPAFGYHFSLGMDYFLFPTETRFHGFIPENYLPLFPIRLRPRVGRVVGYQPSDAVPLMITAVSGRLSAVPKEE